MTRVRHDEKFWRERVQQWAASGLGAREYAAREGLRPDRLFFWKRRLGGSSALAIAGVTFGRVAVQSSVSPRGFEPLEVLTRSGHTVRVSGHPATYPKTSYSHNLGASDGWYLTLETTYWGEHGATRAQVRYFQWASALSAIGGTTSGFGPNWARIPV
jgi:hypothetical protein